MPWYKQFWPWFLIAFPLIAVVGGVTTVLIAAYEPDDFVVEDYYKQGLAINRDRDRQRKAESMGLQGSLVIDPNTGLAHVTLADSANSIRQLQLRLVHPTRASKDLSGTLHRDLNGQLSGAIGYPSAGRWRVVVEPADGAWRLTGRLQLPGSLDVSLIPG